MAETLKEQALEHWRENKRRLQDMNWVEWRNTESDLRRYEILDAVSSYAPQIGGKHCSYCQHYSEMCYITIGDITHERCPLYSAGEGRGSCCKEWRDVRNALLYATTKRAAMAAVEAMIKRLEAINE